VTAAFIKDFIGSMSTVHQGSATILRPFEPVLHSARTEKFEHFVDIEIRYCETDSLQHVNHVSLPSYLEHGLLKMLLAIGDPEPYTTIPFAHVTAELVVRYLRPNFFGETLRIGSRIERVGSKSLTVEQFVFGQDHELRNIGRTVVVRTVDGGTAPWTDAQRAALLSGAAVAV
jgi:acyl-CoA thioester hydrolase